MGGSCECLVAGTKIRTESGLVAIEKLTVGDRVLARNVTTGQLRFRPVIRPTLRPASPTLRISLDGEVIQASGGHPFWVSSTGWVKARDLKPKMRLQTVNGVAEVLSVEPGNTVELYNLVVESDSSYFVGDLGILSHDNTIPSRGSKTLQNRATR
jgi:Pretoxin HINT domain